MSHDLDEVLYDFQLRAFGEELTRVNQLPVEQRRAYVRKLWENRVKRGDQIVAPPEPPQFWQGD